MAEDYQFDDVDTSTEPSSATSGMTGGGSDEGAGASSGGSRGYASEVFSKKLQTKYRTFYIDLKESSNGKFVKISEKSHGRKSTIMMDGEDIVLFIEALKEVQGML